MTCRKWSNCHQVCNVQLSKVPWHTSRREENSSITKMKEINIKLSFPCSKRYPFNSMESVYGAHQHWHPSALFMLFNTPHCSTGKRKGQTLFVTVACLVLWPGIWRQSALERKLIFLTVGRDTAHPGVEKLEDRSSRWLAGPIVTPTLINQCRIQVDHGYKT